MLVSRTVAHALLLSFLSTPLALAGCDSARGAPKKSDHTPPAKTRGATADQTATQQAPGTTAPDPTPPVRGGRPATFADVVKKTRPAVVNIYTRTQVRTNRYFVLPNRRMIPEKRLSESLGSGFIIDQAGHVLTNFHVVKGATDIEVRLFDERRFKADVVGTDPQSDVALLKLADANDLPHLAFADSDHLRVGDWVVAIGNPLGLTSTVTAGIVSATGRKSLPLGGMRYQDFIQTDASINPGNSGGPLLDLDGRVEGINTAINPKGQGIGFAIPINMIAEILPRLKAGGQVQRSWLGIYVDPIPKPLRAELGLPDKGGALVKKIVPGGPAEDANLARGDLIWKIDGHDVEGADQLAWMAGNIGVGKTVALDVQRGDKHLDLSIKLGAQPN